jgi:3-isopropylmalate/(R)-2-methylmalate dehydratase large subunit
MIAFMNAYARNHSRLSARDAAHHFMLRCARDTDSAWPGTGDQPPICHTVSGLYGAAPGAVNANNSRAKAGIRMTQLTLFDKIWAQHEILKAENGNSLLWIDRHYIHEGSFQGFDKVEARGEKVARPDLTFGIADHYVPTNHSRAFSDPSLKHMVEQLADNTKKHGIMLMGMNDPRQGIVHVVGPEQGLTMPGLLIVCGDSHTATHGALGAIAIGIGASEVSHVMLTQTLWQKKPKRMRITVDGKTAVGIGAKDIALSIIAKIGTNGGQGYAIEFAGRAIRALSMEGRLTLCNLAIEAGARTGMVAPDETTFAYVKGRPFAPKGAEFDRAVQVWQQLPSDPDAEFDSEVLLDASAIAPVVTWGTSPEDALPIDGAVPDPAQMADPARAQQMQGALDYMGLNARQKLTDIRIDRVFIGSCTNARIEDLRAAAAVLEGRKAKVPGLVSAGSTLVKHQAEQEGLDKVFTDAGLTWGESGCSMCLGINGDIVPPGERCASTTNRNFRGRQGPGARTHLMSPAMVAAAAVNGHLADVRPLLQGKA